MARAREITYVQSWPEGTELCPVCGQPDNCGDCDHTPLPMEQVAELGGGLVPEGTGLVDGHSIHVCVAVEHEETARTRVFHGSSSLGVREATLDALATADAYYRAGKIIPLSVHPCRIGEAIGS